MRILAIETSADETGIAIIEASGADEHDFRYKILGNALLSQADLHMRYGGIFPNLAKREHGRNLVPVLMEALRQADELLEGKPSTDEKIIAELETTLAREHELFTYLSEFLRAYGKPNIDCIAVTAGPGLEPTLWVGINFAKALAHVWNLRIVPVNHLEGHIVVAMAKNGNPESQTLRSGESDFPGSGIGHLVPIEYPAVALLVSGGHTELVLMEKWGHYKMLGATRDDAAGEAFDKSARLIGLPYPGGPQISRLAKIARDANQARTYELPRPMLKDISLDFSFSGLKTAVKNIVDAWGHGTDDMKNALAREAEEAIVDVLLAKTKRAIEENDAKTVIVGGGVSANDHLRKRFSEEFHGHVHVLFPTPELSTDNGVMIALASYFHAEKKEFIDPADLVANGNLRLVK